MKAQIFKSGKEIKKKPPQVSRIEIIKFFIANLEVELNDISAQLSNLKISKKLQDLITPFFNLANQSLSCYPIASGRVSKKGTQIVINLQKALNIFDHQYSDLKSSDKKIDTLICDLIGAIHWFVTQHDMTIGSVKVHHPLSANPTTEELLEFLIKEKKSLDNEMPARKADFAKRKLYEAEVLKHQKQRDKYPPFKALQRVMEANGYTFAGSTSRYWKRLLENGELFHYLPSKKKRQ